MLDARVRVRRDGEMLLNNAETYYHARISIIKDKKIMSAREVRRTPTQPRMITAPRVPES